MSLKVDRARNSAAFTNDRWKKDYDEEGEGDEDVELDDADIIDRSKFGEL